MRPQALLMYMVLVAVGAAGGGYVYLKWRVLRKGMHVTTTGSVQYRSGSTGVWKVAPERILAGEKDSFRVSTGAMLGTNEEFYGEGSYEVVRDEEGQLRLVSSTKRTAGREPNLDVSADLVSGEAELAVLVRETKPHLEPVALLSTKDWLPMKGVDMEFQDYDVALLEPPSGRNLTSGADIWLHWTPVPFDDVTYVVEIASSMAFADGQPRKTRANRLTVSFTQRGFYFWRVRAVRRGRTTLSKASSFTIK